MSIEHSLSKALGYLKKHHYFTETFLGSNNCFDAISKNGNTKLIIKVYDNIDSIRKEQGEELKKLGHLLGATCIIIGERTKVFDLQDKTVYYRYDIPTITIRTFERMLDEKGPEIRYFKGRHIVDIDSEKVRQKRENLELSLEDLAGKIGVAPESMYRFESGASTSLETALRLEKELQEHFIKKVGILEKNPKEELKNELPDDELLEKMHELGIKMALFRHSPFNAYTDDEKGMFIGTGKGKFDIPKKAFELKKTSTVIDTDSIIITKEYKYKSIGGVPIIGQEELESLSKARDLKKMIKEREEHKQ